jgi:hypothetical protein
MTQQRPLPIFAPIEGRSAWKQADLERDRKWLIEVSSRQAGEIADASTRVLRKGLRAGQFGQDDFPLPTFGKQMANVLEELQNGTGVTLLRGLPVDPKDEEQAAVVIWGLGTYLGRGLRQSAGVNLNRFPNNLIAHIVDQRLDPNDRNVHGSATGAEQEPHCDPSDLVALLCIRPAEDGGGVSRIVSAVSIFNELLTNAPEVLPTLFRGFYNDLRNEGKNGAHVTPEPIPVFGYTQGHLSVCFNSKTVILAAQRDGHGLSADEQRALDAMLDTARSPDLVHEMTLRTGDLQFLNNYTVLHSRTAWMDPPEIARRRCMLRVWVKTEQSRPLPEGFAGGYLTGVHYDVGVQARTSGAH